MKKVKNLKSTFSAIPADELIIDTPDEWPKTERSLSYT